MRIELERKLFIGVRIDNKMRDALDHCPPRDRAYFDGSDPRYLTVVRAVEDSYGGKTIDAGPSATARDDLKRNAISILNPISQSRGSEDDGQLLALGASEQPPLPAKNAMLPFCPVETMSRSLSSFRSAIATATAPAGACGSSASAGANAPFFPITTSTRAGFANVATARSAMPSPLRSPAATFPGAA